MSAYYILTYFAGSFGRFNIHAKVFHWLMTVYPIITALTGFQFSNLLPYILQVVPTILGYYKCDAVQPATRHPPAGDSTPLTAGPSTPEGWGNCPIGKPEKATSPNLKIEESAAQIWNLPHLGGVNSLPCNSHNAGITGLEFGCMKAPKGNQGKCKSEINNTLMAKPLQSQSQKGI
ncbi:hypothetical protein DSO57_1034546 [Entomophthora muscae]|uniref:Uncharacterized protein n=1 Tax=Entomophthora muscae TaxID=34485 RepID=A0ACC2TB55_9FUNG|nr:hypothetical protein DSO57_1034546 [Entomophthora muscae]